MNLNWYRQHHPSKRSEKGAITFEQFGQLLEHAREHKSSQDQLAAVTFHYAFAFRGGRVSKVKRKHFRKDFEGNWNYNGPRDKAQANAEDAERDVHEVMPALNDAVSAILKESPAGNDDALFPRYTSKWVREIVKSAAKHYEWSKLLNWTGHCLRHGSIAEAVAAGGVEAGFARGGHKSISMVAHYSRPNEVRIQQSVQNALGLNTRKRGRPSTRTNDSHTTSNLVPPSITSSATMPQTVEIRKESPDPQRGIKFAPTSAKSAVKIRNEVKRAKARAMAAAVAVQVHTTQENSERRKQFFARIKENVKKVQGGSGSLPFYRIGKQPTRSAWRIPELNGTPSE